MKVTHEITHKLDPAQFDLLARLLTLLVQAITDDPSELVELTNKLKASNAALQTAVEHNSQ